jgi:ATP synthase protein I
MSSRADVALAEPVSGRKQAQRIVVTQLGVTIVIALGFMLMSGVAAAIAALTGGMINVVANFYFARKLYGGARARVTSAVETVLRFYVGEFVKLFVTLALLALAIGVFKLSFIPLFTAFVATLAVFLFALTPRFHKLFGGAA